MSIVFGKQVSVVGYHPSVVKDVVLFGIRAVNLNLMAPICRRSSSVNGTNSVPKECVMTEVLREVFFTLIGLKARRSILWITNSFARPVNHVTLDQLVELWGRDWIGNFRTSKPVNIFRFLGGIPFIQPQDHMAMWQTPLLEFNNVAVSFYSP